MENEFPSGTPGEKTVENPYVKSVAPEVRVPSDRKKESGSSSKLSGIFDAVITTSIVALFFGLPLFFTGMTMQGLAFEKQIYFYLWLLVGVIAWVSKGVVLGEMKIRRTPLDIPVIAFVVVYGLATAFSTDRWDSFWGTFSDPSRGFLSVAALALAYFLITSHFNKKRLQLSFGGLTIASFLLVVWSFLVLMGIRFLPASIEAYAPLSLMGTVTTLALFLSISPIVFMTALFSLFRDENAKMASWKKWLPTVFLLVGLLLNLLLLLALYSFVSWPVIIGGLGFFLIFILAQIVRPAEQWAWVPMVVFVAILAFLMFGSVPLARTNLPVEVIPKFAFAFDIAKKAVAEKFLLGSGPATYGSVFSLYRPVEYNQNSLFTLRFDQTPGIFLEALSTIGALGTIAYLVLCLSFVSIGIYLLSNDKSRNKLFSLGIWSIAVSFFIASFISAFNGPILLIASLLASLALATVLWESGTEERHLTLSLKASPKFALALAFVFMVVSAGVAFLFVFLGKVLVADISAGSAVREAGATEQAATQLGRAASLNPQEKQYLISLGQTYISLANQEAAKPESERDTNKVAGLIKAAIQVTERAYSLAPESVRTAEAAGLIYENSSLYASDALSKAFDYYKKASDLEPNNPVILVKLGQVKRAMGDNVQAEGADKTAAYNEAKGYFESAVEKKADLGIAHYNLAVVLSRLKDYGTAIDETNKAIVLEKTNVTYAYSLGTLYQLRKGDGDLDKAQKIYEDILKSNEKLVDVRLALGLLHEEKKEKDQALAEYRKILTYLPDGDQGDTLRKQINVFIETLQNGGSNLAKSTPPAAPAPTSEAAPAASGQVPVAAPETVPAPTTPTPASTPAVPGR
ncbi:MAG: tetratricopeptide repeat protein [Candidatus Moranbacteria bacterium]|nr:tetratricopeptide repeat protein [Candidatus Moranbacteria bacterium]